MVAPSNTASDAASEPSASEAFLTIKRPCGRDLVGEVRAVVGGVIAGAEVSIAEVSGWASELPGHVRPRWSSSEEGGVVISGQVEVTSSNQRKVAWSR